MWKNQTKPVERSNLSTIIGEKRGYPHINNHNTLYYTFIYIYSLPLGLRFLQSNLTPCLLSLKARKKKEQKGGRPPQID